MHRTSHWSALLAVTATVLVGTTACGFDPGCLAEGTQVATPSGPVAIETLRPGDVVYSVDPEGGTLRPTAVVAVRAHRRPCLALTAGAGQTIVATADHPVYDPVQRGYVPVGRWPAARRVPGTRRVYDVTVASKFANFLANGVLVHNKSPGSHEYLGEIEDFVSVRDVASGVQAVRVAPPLVNYSDHGLPIRMEVDPDGLGPDVVRVTADEPFDALLVEAHTETHYLGGYLHLTPPAPAMALDLEVELQGIEGEVFLTMGAWVAGQLGPAEFVVLTPQP